MGPKKSPAKVDDNSWRTHIENTPLNDVNWKVKVIMLEAAGSEQDRIYLSKFEKYAENEKRFVIKSITKTQTIFMVNQLGGEKKEPDEAFRIFEEAHEAMKKDKTGLSPEMLALLIKHQMLKMKTEYLFIQKQKLELKEGMRQESATMIDRAEVRGTIVKPPEPAELPKSKKGKKEQVAEVSGPEEGKKYNTSLRERGEEWRDKSYVDDYPVDGSDLYVAITGFTNALLANCLVRIGVPLSALIQVRIDSSTTKLPETLARASKREQSKSELLAEQAVKFWDDIQELRIYPELAHEYKDIAFVVFRPPYRKENGNELKDDPETIYDELSFLMYDIQDLSRQHINYLENIDIIRVPKEEADVSLLYYYNEYVSRVPNESATVFFILDSMLNAVTEITLDHLSTLQKETDHPLTSGTIFPQDHTGNAKTLITEVFRALQSESGKENETTKQENSCAFENPVVINYGDYASQISFHLRTGIYFSNMNCLMLIDMPLNRLWQNIPIRKDEREAKMNYHLNVLMNSFSRDDVELTEMYRLLHILAFRKLYNNRSSNQFKDTKPTPLDDFVKSYLKRSSLAEPLHKSKLNVVSSTSVHSINQTSSLTCSEISEIATESCISNNLLFDCPDISELISVAELISSKPVKHMIDDFEYFEDFDFRSSLQVVHSVFNEFNCVDYRYCEATDSIYLMFFNSHTKEGLFTEEWRTDLTTPLCMQDFFDFILDEQYEWIQNEEKAYDEMVNAMYLTHKPDEFESASNRSCIDKTSNIQLDMLLEGSLKYDELLKDIELSSSDSPTKMKTNENKHNQPNSSSEITKSSKKSKSSKGFSTPRTFTSSSFKSSIDENIKMKPFLGYDLGDRRIEIFGRNGSFFSRDGTKVQTKYFMLFPDNQEYVTLKMVSGNKNNEIYMHKALGMYTQTVFNESIRIVTKYDVIVNLQKQFYQITAIPPPVLEMSTASLSKQKHIINKIADQVILAEPMYESYYSLFITSPNGLIVESIHEKKSTKISHIKQYFEKITTNAYDSKGEEMRCISRAGEVIIFKKSGEIEILRPDSTYILCTKYEWKVMETAPSLSELTSSIRTDSASTRKKMNKDKAQKDKKNKSADTMPSFLESEPPNEPVYDLEFIEYTMIEANGKKRIYHDGYFEDIEVLLIRTASDFCSGEVFSRRMDGTNLLYNKDGMLTVTFPNKTRIVSQFTEDDIVVYPEWTEEEKLYFEIGLTSERDSYVEETFNVDSSAKSYDFSESRSKSRKSSKTETFEEINNDDGYIMVHLIFIVEHVNFATVTINSALEDVTVDMPNAASVSLNDKTHYVLRLDKRTQVLLDSENLHMDYEACIKCNSRTLCDINISKREHSNNAEWLRLRDSFGKCVSVDSEGVLYMTDDDLSERIIHEEDLEDKTQRTVDKSEGSIASHGKCRDAYLAHQQRFFVLHRDLTVSELVHKLAVEDYKKTCRWQPWCSVNDYDVFGDNRQLLSILSPVNLNESQKWLMDSKFVEKPTNMTFKHLNNDDGKGFYKWMRPFERFKVVPQYPPPAVAPGLPKALILRTLEQQWKENVREKFKGAKELVMAIMKYRKKMEDDKKSMTGDPIRDLRSQTDIKQYEKVQEFAQRVIAEKMKNKIEEESIEKMKLKMEEHVGVCASEPLKLIRIPLEREEEQLTLSNENETVETTKSSVSTAQDDLVGELEAIAPMSRNLQKYWKRRADEKKEEEYYREVLRLGYVPPYFENLYGGEIWWELNHTAENAVSKAEDRKNAKCSCSLSAPKCKMSCLVCEGKSKGSKAS